MDRTPPLLAPVEVTVWSLLDKFALTLSNGFSGEAGVGDGVIVGVLVGVELGVFEGVLVGVAVGVFDGAEVGVEVGGGLGVVVGVLVGVVVATAVMSCIVAVFEMLVAIPANFELTGFERIRLNVWSPSLRSSAVK